MLSRFLPVAARLFILCLLLIGGTRFLARSDPPPSLAALLPDPSCEPPCWMGFRPGYITSEAVQSWIDDPPGDWQARVSTNIMREPGYNDWDITLPDGDSFRLRAAGFQTPQVYQMMLWPEEMELGDLIAALGEPDFIDFTASLNPQNQQILDFRVYYEGPRLVAWGTILPGIEVMFPNTAVHALVYGAPPWVRPILAFDWRGMGSLSRYYPHGVFQ